MFAVCWHVDRLQRRSIRGDATSGARWARTSAVHRCLKYADLDEVCYAGIVDLYLVSVWACRAVRRRDELCVSPVLWVETAASAKRAWGTAAELSRPAPPVTQQPICPSEHLTPAMNVLYTSSCDSLRPILPRDSTVPSRINSATCPQFRGSGHTIWTLCGGGWQRVCCDGNAAADVCVVAIVAAVVCALFVGCGAASPQLLPTVGSKVATRNGWPRHPRLCH